MQTDDGSTSDSWSLVSNQGDLIDSDEYSISESEPPSESADILPDLGLIDDEVNSNINGSDYQRISDSEEETDADSDETDLTDVEEFDEEEIENESYQSFNEINAPMQRVNDNLCSSELPDNFFSLDIQNGRRIQIFVFASILSVFLMSAFFGDTFGINQLRNYCHAKTPEPISEPIRFNEHVLSFEPKFEKPLWTEEPTAQEDEQKEEEQNDELSQCHLDLNDAVKTASLNSVLMRYMRSKGSRLETLINELQSVIENQRKEIETLQQSNAEPQSLLQSETSAGSDDQVMSEYPCYGDDDIEELEEEDLMEPSNQPSKNPPLPPTFEPDEDRSKFGTCADHSFLNLTRIFLNKVAMMANSTALTLFVDSRPELAKFTNWLQKQTFKAFPRMIENVRTNWRFKFRSYMQKVSNALSTPAITSLTKRPHNFVGQLKKKINSIFDNLSKNSRFQNDVCSNATTCELLIDFGNYLANDQVFRGNLTPKQADSYVEFLKHIPQRQCKENSTLVGCERCWWVQKCEGIKKKCNLRRWQRQNRIDPKLFIDNSPKVKEIFKNLGWVDSKELTVVKPLSEPIGPPRHKKEKYRKNDWLMRRGAKRADYRRRSSTQASDWFFARYNQRRAIRNNNHASDWFFDRGSHRAVLRGH